VKASHQCPRCGSRAVGYLPSQPDETDSGTTTRTLGRVEKLGLLFAGRHPAARLESYVCTACGYHESYVHDPGGVEWEKLVGFRWVNPPPDDGDGPYR